jgi:2-haloacid dehalogenase
MEWDAFFASDLIGAYKPSKEAYQTAIKALELKPSECIMVAAHVYDLKAAAHK